jgi:predicted dehydrogenase
LTTRSGTRILLIGCGELGSRHLQAVCTLETVSQIEVVDPRPAALELGRRRLAEVEGRNRDITVQWLAAPEKASKGGDLCIVATQAEGRNTLIRQAANELGYNAFIVEKIVTQSLATYQDLLDFTERQGIGVWVNFKSRAYHVHKRIKDRLDSFEPIHFNAIAGNHGLATNGMHAIDLFVFHDACGVIENAGAQIDPVLHPSKRGNAVFDLSGTMAGYSEKGSHLSISYAAGHESTEHISIVAPRYRAIVDHVNRCGWESDVDRGWQWRPMEFAGNPFVSSMTREFAADILARGQCELPTLAEGMPAHKFVFAQLLPHFNRLLAKDDDLCPVT